MFPFGMFDLTEKKSKILIVKSYMSQILKKKKKSKICFEKVFFFFFNKKDVKRILKLI